MKKKISILFSILFALVIGFGVFALLKNTNVPVIIKNANPQQVSKVTTCFIILFFICENLLKLVNI